jgi:S1-C subfamily serine protease
MNQEMKDKKITKDLIECIVIGVVVGTLAFLGVLQYQNNKRIENKIDKIESTIGVTEDVIGSLITHILSQTEIVKNLDKHLADKIEDRLQQQKLYKIKLEQTLRQVNVMIVNKTIMIQGSGASIKYRGKFYILTAGHMAKNNDDELYLYENNNQICKLEVVKHDFPSEIIDTTKNDLLLLRPINPYIIPRFYTELAEIEPIAGIQLYIVGNPMGIEDVVSDGRVIVYQDNYMYYIDHTYFGNSGGGVYTDDGKVVGIVSHMYNLKLDDDAPDYVINGAVRLDTILQFMKDVY